VVGNGAHASYAAPVADSGFRLGIDFGTSNTVAVLRWPDARTKPLLFDGSPLLPSAVYVEESGAVLTGRDAVHTARLQPHRFEPYPKRHIEEGTVWLGDREIRMVDLLATVLRRVATEAQRVAGRVPEHVTLTHPAAWASARRDTLAQAARAAGLPAPQLASEPVAAASYFVATAGSNVPVGGCAVVYDFGAGTFDASVVRRNAGGGFEVLANEGLADAGGLDVDAAVMAYLGQVLAPRAADQWRRITQPETPADRRAAWQLWEDVRLAKEMLSRATSTYIQVPLIDESAPLGREQLETLARPILDRTVTATQLAVASAGLAPDRVAAIFLVGGSSRIPLAATLLHRAMGLAPTAIEQPEMVVAEGALQLAPLTGRVSVPAASAGSPSPLGPALPGSPVSGGPASARPVSAGPVSAGPVSGGPVSGGPVPGRPVPGRPISGGPVPGSPVPGRPISGGPVPGGPVPGGPVPGGAVGGPPVSPGPAPGGPLSGAPRPGAAAPGPAAPGVTRPAPAPFPPAPGSPAAGAAQHHFHPTPPAQQPFRPAPAAVGPAAVGPAPMPYPPRAGAALPRRSRAPLVVGVAAGVVLVLLLAGGITVYALRGGGKGGSHGGDAAAPACGFKLAVLGVLSGDNAGDGQTIRDAAKLAVQRYNDASSGCTAELAEFDTQNASSGKDDQAAERAREIVADEKILGVVGPVYGSEAEDALPILEEAGVPVVSPSATEADLSQKGWKVFHRTLGTDIDQADAAVRYLTKVAKVGKTFVVDDGSTYGSSVAGEVHSKLGDGSAGTATIDSTGEYADVVKKIVDSGADSVYYGGYYEDGGAFVKQLRQASRGLPIVSGDRVFTDLFVDSAGKDAAEGVVITCPCIPPSQARGSFAQDYKSRYNEAAGYYAPEAYDAANILLAGLHAGNGSRSDLLAFVDGYDGDGVSRHIRFGEHGDLDVPSLQVWSYKVVGGAVKVQAVIPES
jgi:ABC-type branched-subunit amino acid transport system substrate-binding protein